MPLRPIKQFGQHFLNDESFADRIIEAAGIEQGETVWEIGPGKGILTERLLQKTEKLTAFEIDTRLFALLEKRFGCDLRLVNKDILAVNWKEELLKDSKGKLNSIKLVSNLPYQITSPVLYALEENAEWFSRAVIMIQKEVAERLVSEPGRKTYGVLTLKLGYAYRTELLLTVPPEAFKPVPKVDSAVVSLKPRLDKPILKSLDIYRLIINKAFAHRRKTLKNNLRQIYAPELVEELEKMSGLDFNRRGETLEEAEFIRLADCAYDLSGNKPGPVK
jgi:16S rRNA (adenine1518-N6/adenine1519-N6)-dimethyltransferase